MVKQNTVLLNSSDRQVESTSLPSYANNIRLHLFWSDKGQYLILKHNLYQYPLLPYNFKVKLLQWKDYAYLCVCMYRQCQTQVHIGAPKFISFQAVIIASSSCLCVFSHLNYEHWVPLSIVDSFNNLEYIRITLY